MELFQQLSFEPSFYLLFLLSFLAATVVPIGSEWLLVVMLLGDFSPAQTVITASFGNYLGGCTTYLIGIYGSDFFAGKLLRISDSDMVKARGLYQKYGSWSLLLSWLPVVGDPLCLLAGVFRIGFTRFSLLIFSGKFLRYTTLALITLKIIKG